MLRDFIHRKPALTAIALFISVYAIVVMMMLVDGSVQLLVILLFFNNDGSIREFGLAMTRRSIVPIWLAAVIIGILCYLGVLSYIAGPTYGNV